MVCAVLSTSLYLGPLAPVAYAEDFPPASRNQAPNTDKCPQRLTPPSARSTSETPLPGMSTPAPLPVQENSDGFESCGVIAPAGFHVPEEVLASAWLVADLDSGEVIAAKDPHGRYRPASVIKVLLALVAIDHLDLEHKVVASSEAADMEGSRVGIGPGGTYSNRELLYGLLLASGNDAAKALAEELGGDETTLSLVNDLAQHLGAQDTRVMDYTGLDHLGQSSSAIDLARFYQAAWQNPVFAQAVATDHIDFPGWGKNPGFEVWNDNGLLLNDDHGIGGKTGYTDDANHTFVGAVDSHGRRLVAVLLDTTVDKGRPWEQAQKLLAEADQVPRGSGVGTLGTPATFEEASSDSPSPTPGAQPIDDAYERDGTAEKQQTRPLYLAIGIVAGIIALAAAARVVWRLGGRRT
ncbi:D-alanyl-D-alanine carboxypeptidase [Corynebacterium poyangense]|uniref:D-alanyl-D-alanine carboxypeptidase n=1 Tax=Corynebacterium poyangense TaxID=2684405 RepID=A0A7H0SMD8_9CORY|nr:D-alanyl-D-alanine carboxypeptidase family protein [Corynebacterium poyangense]QNQ89713.1 D-alanyl-D-alanine carboxypeptidase [Corynebacterium poyangense]